MNDATVLLDEWRARALKLEEHAGRVVLGQARAIRLITYAVFVRGHVLLQGDVGVGKTTLLRTFARLLGGAFTRIEGTVDLMPSDLVYHTYVGENGRPAVDPGPLLRHGENLAILFFNEINRARPQVHALLLRVMAERTLSAFNREYSLPHLLVFADRNRIEREETFEIPSAARDRFLMEVEIESPRDDAVRRALMVEPRFHNVDRLIASVPQEVLPHVELNGVAATIQEHVQLSETLERYALDLWRASVSPVEYGIQIEDVNMRELVLAGASPRGMSMLLQGARVAAWLANRSYVTPEDVRDVYAETIAHRLAFQPVYEIRRGELSAELVRKIKDHVASP